MKLDAHAPKFWTFWWWRKEWKEGFFIPWHRYANIKKNVSAVFAFTNSHISFSWEWVLKKSEAAIVIFHQNYALKCFILIYGYSHIYSWLPFPQRWLKTFDHCVSVNRGWHRCYVTANSYLSYIWKYCSCSVLLLLIPAWRANNSHLQRCKLCDRRQ